MKDAHSTFHRNLFDGYCLQKDSVSNWIHQPTQEGGQTFQGFSRRGFPHHKVNAGLRLTWPPTLTGEVLYHHVGATSYPLSDARISLAPFFPPGTVVPHEQVRSYNLLNLKVGCGFLQQKSTAGSLHETKMARSPSSTR